MAVVQDFYQNRRNLGAPAMVAYLDAWLGERSSMNKSLMKAEMDAGDPAKLAEQEARIRRAIADLVQIKEKGSQAEKKATSDLAKENLRGSWGLAKANAGASATVAAARIGGIQRSKAVQAEYRKRVADDLTIKDPDTLAIIDKTTAAVKADLGGRSPADQVTLPNGQAGKLGQRIDDLVAANAGNPSKRDAIVSDVIARYAAAGDAATVDALTKRYGDGANDWAAVMSQRHPDFTEEEHKAVLDEMKRVRAGGSSAESLALYKELAAAGDGGTSILTSSESSKPPPGIDAQIAELEKAADDLADQRRKSGGSRRFPRPNYMIANPNTYTDPRYVSELKAWGVMDPEYVTEVFDSVERTGSFQGANKEIGERGGISMVPERIPAALLTDDTDEVSPLVEKVRRRNVVGEGGWEYTLNNDGTIARKGPDGKAYKPVAPGSKEHEAIVNELYQMDGPDAVVALLRPVQASALAGRWDEAEAKATATDANDLRRGWAQAIRDVSTGRPAFSGVPADGQAAALIRSVGDAPGKWKDSLRHLYSQPMTNQYETGRVVTGLRSLADAMDAVPDIERAEVARGAYDRMDPLGATKPGIVAEREADMASTIRSATPLVAARPSPDQPLRLGGVPTVAGRVTAPDMDLEAGGAASEVDPDIADFMTMIKVKDAPTDTDIDDFRAFMKEKK